MRRADIIESTCSYLIDTLSKEDMILKNPWYMEQNHVLYMKNLDAIYVTVYILI